MTTDEYSYTYNTANDSECVEPIVDVNEWIDKICRKYIIADQTMMINRMWERMNGFRAVDLKNCDMYPVSTVPFRFYLIYNDFANELEKLGEPILTNHCGTWWLVKHDETTPLSANAAIRQIAYNVATSPPEMVIT
jgi:hypothetical protein